MSSFLRNPKPSDPIMQPACIITFDPIFTLSYIYELPYIIDPSPISEFPIYEFGPMRIFGFNFACE